MREMRERKVKILHNSNHKNIHMPHTHAQHPIPTQLYQYIGYDYLGFISTTACRSGPMLIPVWMCG